MSDFIKRNDLPSYKKPGVFPSGSDMEVGLDSSNLLENSLGNWNNIIRDEGPVDDEGNSTPRVFVSFASFLNTIFRFFFIAYCFFKKRRDLFQYFYND